MGRERELHELRELTAKERLITLNGIGGVGKSRLAIELATSCKDAFQDGVWIIQLAPLTDESLISQSVAAALNIREQPDQEMLGTLLDFIRNREILLILDNCEHLIRGCALFAETALSHAPKLKIIATSRESLGIMGEIQWRVPSLSLPDVPTGSSLQQARSSEAIELFHQRAREVNNRFSLTEDNWATVARICERLDGIPLAIELAAGLCKALSAEEISDRLVDRFSLLTGGSRTALPRQQTLIATMDWSYDLLPEDERRILGQLSVFSGGFSLEAAEAVVGENAEPLEVLRGIVNLVSKSLIVQEQEVSNTRYDILETVRQYAAQRLLESGESANARNRHLDYFLDRAEAAEPHLHAGSQETVVASLELEHDNYRAALDWSIDRIPDKAIRLAAALWYFWDLHGHLIEGRRWLKTAQAAHPGSLTAWQGRALMGAGSLERAQGNLEEARGLLEQALNVYRELRDEVGTARALDELGSIAYLKCDFEMGESLCGQSLALYRKHHDLEGVASSLFSMGHWATTRGQFEESDSLLKECLALCKSLGFVQGQGAALASIARLRLHLGDAETASRLAGQALAYSTRIRDDWNIGFIELVSGEASMHRSDLDLADRHLLESLGHFKTRGDQWGFARSMRCMASVKRMRGQMQPARSMLQHSMTICKSLESHWDLAQALEEQAHLVVAEDQDLKTAMTSLGAAQQLRDTVGAPLPPMDQAALLSIVRRAKAELGEAQTSSCLEKGRRRPWPR
ncbi:MAG: tetratricopeptide repeat protein [Actinomycetota bacterium]|nr:tetratricopeptide repeat protein [Actinomycetota bacterium]